MSKTQHIRAVVEEQFIQSKTGRLEDCEDSILINEHFIAVIDGATSHTTRRWDKETGGKIAAKIIGQAFSEMPFDYTARQAADLMTSMINDFYARFNITKTVKKDPSQRISASFAAITLFRQEVWLIGDCQFLLGNQHISNQRIVDRILSDVRALFLEVEVLNGMTIEQLSQNEKGREFIMPLLKGHIMFQNNPSLPEYWYSAVDGFTIPDAGIIIKTVPDDVDSIVLASDGYPVLKDNLKETENTLQNILLKDPLMFREYKSTKGKLKGDISFDDRAFIKVKLEH